MPWDRSACPPPRALSLIDALRATHEISWARNTTLELDADTVAAADEAADRFDRFAPWVAEHYPETRAGSGGFGPGIIESPVEEVPDTKDYLSRVFERDVAGSLWIKRDDALPISGSIKARGGIHEVFRLAEERPGVTITVASTGNLGLSIGTVGPQLGFPTEVHMSIDAKQWKKDRLRAGGAAVVEHPGLFTDTVAAARAAATSSADESGPTFFIDDENSLGLFAGYAVAGRRLKAQFDALGKEFTPDSPLIVYLPCGVGGGPGGVAFGLKQAFGPAVQCHIVEPVTSPCMALGLATGKGAEVSGADYGLSGRTIADGLAVQRPSPLVVKHADALFDGIHTLADVTFLAAVNWLERTTGIVVEPSATAGLTIPWRLPDVPDSATHLVWLTGGSLIPDQDRERLRGQAATAAIQHSTRA
nr:threonine dehydratase [Streptococcus thermophilus]